jgi:amphi-Trp domain-containing protein
MSDKQSLEFEAKLDAGNAADYFEALARGLRDGRIIIESGNKSLNLEVAGDIVMELELEAKSNPEKGKSSVELELSWKVVPQKVEEAPASLLITTGSDHSAHEGESEIILPGNSSYE